MAASRQLADAAENGAAVEREFLPDDGMACHDDKAAARVDPRGVGIMGVRRSHDLRPVFADRVFRRFPADLVPHEEVLDETGECPGGALPLFRRLDAGHAAQVADQLFGDLAELEGLFLIHDGYGMAPARLRRNPRGTGWEKKIRSRDGDRLS